MIYTSFILFFTFCGFCSCADDYGGQSVSDLRSRVKSELSKPTDFPEPLLNYIAELKTEFDDAIKQIESRKKKAQIVSPAFQWAQSDTHIFITVKFTRRWNAPGALQVSDPVVSYDGDHSFVFSGRGEHSNNVYDYKLNIQMFDFIDASRSKWNTGSVGKLQAQIAKKTPGNWPRLFANKKAKPDNAHVWMDYQEQLQDSLKSLNEMKHSAITCLSADQKIYCPHKDLCVKDCSSCDDQTFVDANSCLGPVRNLAGVSLNFTDTDSRKNHIKGKFEFSVPKHISTDDIEFRVFFGDKDKGRISAKNEDESSILASIVGSAKPAEPLIVLKHVEESSSSSIVGEIDVTKLPENAENFLVYAVNKFGESTDAFSTKIKDIAIPSSGPVAASFVDTNPKPNELSGSLFVNPPKDAEDISSFALHWGKSAKAKILKKSHISDAPFNQNSVLNDAGLFEIDLVNQTIPTGATHILVFSKSSDGEFGSEFANIPIVDLKLEAKVLDSGEVEVKFSGDVGVFFADEDKEKIGQDMEFSSDGIARATPPAGATQICTSNFACIDLPKKTKKTADKTDL